MSKQSSGVNRWVRVAGTGRSKGLPNAVHWIAEALGRALGREGYGLVTGGWAGVDYIVSEAFEGEVRKRRRPLSTSLIQVVAGSTQPDFPGGRVVHVQPGPEGSIEGLKYADVVVLVGGEGGTYQTYSYAVQEGRPTFPIAATEGDARRVFEEMLSKWADSQLEGISIDDFRERLGIPISDRHDADLVIEGLMKLLRAHFMALSGADSITASSTFPGTIAILFLAADPTDASRLRLGEEFREIQEKLRLAKHRDRFLLDHRTSVRPQDISQALLDVQPDIVHFSGHGTATGALCVEDESGRTHSIEPDALAALFRQFKGRVKCVILNACYSETQARAIARHIAYVIGMNKVIGDKAAIAFAVGFYQALGAGHTVEGAYELGCVQIRLRGIPEHLTPVLIKKKGRRT